MICKARTRAKQSLGQKASPEIFIYLILKVKFEIQIDSESCRFKNINIGDISFLFIGRGIYRIRTVDIYLPYQSVYYSE